MMNWINIRRSAGISCLCCECAQKGI